MQNIQYLAQRGVKFWITKQIHGIEAHRNNNTTPYEFYKEA